MKLVIQDVKANSKVITYDPFYKTLNKKNMSGYELIFKRGISANAPHRMKRGKAIATKTLDTLCFTLNCKIEEVIEYRNK